MIVTNTNTKQIQGRESMPTDTNKLSVVKLSIYALGLITISIVTIEFGIFVGGLIGIVGI